MMDQAEAARLLLRWNEQVHEHWPEIQALREAAVSERRIEALYPPRAHGDYTAKLCAVLENPRAFTFLHKRFKADRQLLMSSATGWSVEFEPTADGLTPSARSIFLGTAHTGDVVDCLHRLYPRKFSRWPAASHEFASALFILPMLAEVISQRKVRKIYRFALGANRKATDIDFEQLAADVQLVLDLVQNRPLPTTKRLNFLLPTR